MLNKVQILGTDIVSSAIGFGCASLGSRVSKQKGLSAIESAFDEGVSWYDVAPAYGAGEAEIILSEFLRGRRDKVFVCSKVGVLPPARNDILRFIYTVARPTLKLASGLRRNFRRMSATRNQLVPINPDIIQKSIDSSLSRLRTDYLDVFALHKPEVLDLTRDDNLRALERIVASGKARYISVAGDMNAAAAAADFKDVYKIFQLSDNPSYSPLSKLTALAGRPLGFVTHSVLGVDGALDRLHASLADRPEDIQKLRAAGYDGNIKDGIANLLLDRALASNKNGVVLLSMFSPRHRTNNLARAMGPTREDSIRLVDELLSGNVRIESVI